MEVSVGLISKWLEAFKGGGSEALKLGYKGSKAYLSEAERAQVIQWLIEQKSWDISELEIYLIEQYEVVFQSRQSYYQILKEAKISWQEGEKVNPRYDKELTKKNQEIAELLERYRQDIEYEKLVVYLIDEGHLKGGDICGYLGNFRKNPLKISLFNPKERQTYYGALNLFNREFILML